MNQFSLGTSKYFISLLSIFQSFSSYWVFNLGLRYIQKLHTVKFRALGVNRGSSLIISSQLNKHLSWTRKITNQNPSSVQGISYTETMLIECRRTVSLLASSIYPQIKIFLRGFFFRNCHLKKKISNIKMSQLLQKWSCYYLIRPASE